MACHSDATTGTPRRLRCRPLRDRRRCSRRSRRSRRSVREVQPGENTAVDRPPGRSRRRLLLASVVGVVALLAIGLWWATASGPAPLRQADVDAAVQRGIAQAQEQERATPPDGTTAYRTIGPSLATVTVQRPGSGGTVENGLGSGVVVNADGHRPHRLHVVDGAGQIQVEFADGTQAAAQVAAPDPRRTSPCWPPTALPQVVVPAVLAGPAAASATTVFAVGNPLGLRRRAHRRRGVRPRPHDRHAERHGAARAHPVRRRRQPRQLRRPAAQPGRAGRRHRRPRWPTRPGSTSSSGSASPSPSPTPAAQPAAPPAVTERQRGAPVEHCPRPGAGTLEQVLFQVKKTHRRPGRAARAADRRPARPGPRARRGRARPGQDHGGQVAGRSDRRPVPAHPVHARTWCRPTSSAPASTTSARGSSRSRSARCSPTCCWPTRSTGRPRRCRARCSR